MHPYGLGHFFTEVFCSHCRDSINAMKQNGFGLAQDLQLITGNWGFELSDVPPVYHGPLHIWQGGEDWCVSPSLQRLVKNRVSDLIFLKGFYCKSLCSLADWSCMCFCVGMQGSGVSKGTRSKVWKWRFSLINNENPWFVVVIDGRPLTWCIFMSFVGKGICLPSATMTRYTGTRFQLCLDLRKVHTREASLADVRTTLHLHGSKNQLRFWIVLSKGWKSG